MKGDKIFGILLLSVLFLSVLFLYNSNEKSDLLKSPSISEDVKCEDLSVHESYDLCPANMATCTDKGSYCLEKAKKCRNKVDSKGNKVCNVINIFKSCRGSALECLDDDGIFHEEKNENGHVSLRGTCIVECTTKGSLPGGRL